MYKLIYRISSLEWDSFLCKKKWYKNISNNVIYIGTITFQLIMKYFLSYYNWTLEKIFIKNKNKK